MPSDPSEPAPARSLRDVGCNRLWCHRCEVFVRQRPNAVTTGEPPSDAPAILYKVKDWGRLDWVWLGGRVARLYSCKCSFFNCTQGVPVDKGDDAEWYEHRIELPPWYCKGHPVVGDS